MTFTSYINEYGEKIILKKYYFIKKYKHNENLPTVSSYIHKYKLIEKKKNVMHAVSDEENYTCIKFHQIDYFKGKIKLKCKKIFFFAYCFSSSNQSSLLEAKVPKENDISKYSFCIQSRLYKNITLKEQCELAKKVKVKYIKNKKASLQDLPVNISTRRSQNIKIRDNVGIIRVSNSRQTDSVKIATKLLEDAGFKVTIAISINSHEIEEAFKNMLINTNVNIIICIGGTGISKTDITIEVIKSVLQKEIDGFGELFRYLTHMKWKHLTTDLGILSIDTRTTAGVANNKLIFAIPGSPDATELAIKEIIIPGTPSLLGQLQKDS